MRLLVASAAVAAMVAGSALAQSTPLAGQDNSAAERTKTSVGVRVPTETPIANPAIKTNEGNNPGAPVPGANSFTEGQAKAQIESRGYVNVTNLEKDANGFWRGRAAKEGRAVNITLDFQGNVVAN